MIRLIALVVLMALPFPVAAAPETVELLVPRTTIYPGDVVPADQLHVRQWRLRPGNAAFYVLDRKQVSGLVAARTLVADRPIPLASLKAVDLVRRGDLVRVEFGDGALTITGLARALEAGAAGSVISLRNVDTGAVIHGTIATDGSVRAGDR